MRPKDASSSCKCKTRLIVTRHHYAAWVWSCTNFVHRAQYTPLCWHAKTFSFSLMHPICLSKKRCLNGTDPEFEW